MVEIGFSVMEGNAGDSQALLPLLQAFEQQYHVHVNLTGINWDGGWTEIAKYGIYGSGPDVSSIGTTWIGSLASMQALRPYTPQEVRALGGAEAFFEASWQTGLLPKDPTPWAIPWLADVHVLYFWKDALVKAGIGDAAAAFATASALVETLAKLHKDAGCAYPLVLTTIASPVILHEAAHWVWGAGGDFVSADGREIIFNQPAALQGFHNYFSLEPFISPKSLLSAPRGDLFDNGEAAVYFAGPFVGNIGRAIHPEWGDNLGIVRTPGASFVGGSSLVIWPHSRHPQEAYELVRFLSSQPTRIQASPHDQALPTRRDALNMPSVENNIFDRITLQALQHGRSFPTIRLWGAVEEKMIVELAAIWAELFANPQTDIDACLHRHLDPLAQRLNMVLGN